MNTPEENKDLDHLRSEGDINLSPANLKRGTMDSDRFKYGKQIGLTFRKVN